ncbi:glomulin-like [Brachionichthys hirsutus]|uniref:glomulin-like n=1 Tax=Brachionichthys hirsutus TaxID=412623 RepID=UPI0036053E96
MNEDPVDDVIQRWRTTPEEDLKPEDYAQFKTFGSACLAEGDSARLLRFLQDEKNQGIVKSMGGVLTAPLVKEAIKKEKSLNRCQAAITHLIRTCRPDELLQSLLQLAEDVEAGDISETVSLLVPHLQAVLLRLEEKAASVGLALSALQQQLSRLPVPFTRQQEEADEFGLCRCCSALTAFTQPFIREVGGTKGTCCRTAQGEDLRRELLEFCLRSLRDVLLEAHVSRDPSPLRSFAAEIMVTLPALQESLSGLLFFSSLEKTSRSKEARACLAYLLFVQRISIDSFPAVFSPAFVLQSNMEHIDQLLGSKKESHLLKGLALCGQSLEMVGDSGLPVSVLELRSFHSAAQNLRRVLTDCPMQRLRESALQVFQLFIHKLDAEAKHKFFRCMLKTSNHTGVESYIIKNIRSQVDLSVQPGNTNQWFLGEQLLSLLRLVLCLPQAADTDLLGGMDRIMESLNLLRYLLLRDARHPADVWEEMSRIKGEYLEMLRVCIGISRAFYSAELKALREDRRRRAREARDAARSVKSIKLEREKVSTASPAVQHQVLQSALVTFDLMESLIIRIDEITEQKRKIPN